MSINKTVFAIYGRANQGKSKTIKQIAQAIIQAYPHATVSPDKIEDDDDIKATIITIEKNTEKIKIGIESQGDPGSRLSESLEGFSDPKKDNVDIIVCATRTKGGTRDKALSKVHDRGYQIVDLTNYRLNKTKQRELLNRISDKHISDLIQQKIKDQQELLNSISAKHIFDLIQQVMNGEL